jgi:ABC-2 type transport system permease protein
MTSTFTTVLRCELKLLRRDPAFWTVLVLLVCAVWLGIASTQRHLGQQAALVAAAQADEADRLNRLKAQLRDVEAGRLVPASPFRDPRSALWVGLTHGAQPVALPPAPLAVAAVGLSDLQPATIAVSARSKDEFLFAEEIRNPAHLLAGPIDLAFVLVFILPLAVLALSYNVVSAERENGTLALAASTGSDMRRVMLGKLAVRTGSPIAAALVAAGIGFAVAGVAPSTAWLTLALYITVYGAFWGLLAGWVNGRGGSSAHNAMALAAAWIALVLVSPAALNLVSDTLYPVPTRAEMVLAARGATVEADRDRDAALARYRDESPENLPQEQQVGSAKERLARRVAVVDAATARVGEVIDRHDAQIVRRQTLIDRLSWLSPALLMQLAVTDVAGSGSTRYAAFHAELDGFHQQWRTYFMARARADKALTEADYGSFPRFAATPALTANSFDGTAGRLWGLLAMAVFCGIGAVRSIRHCESAVA